MTTSLRREAQRRMTISRIRAKEKAAAARQVRNDRAARKAGTYGMTPYDLVMRDQFNARVAAATAEQLARLLADEPAPEPEPPPGPFTKQFKEKL